MSRTGERLCDILGHEYEMGFGYSTVRLCTICRRVEYLMGDEWIPREQYLSVRVREDRKHHTPNMVELPLEATPPAMATVAFAGHRPQQLGGFDSTNPYNQAIIRRLREAIERAYNAGYRHFLSGGALGIDQWAARLVLDMKEEGKDVSLFVVRPFDTQEAVWNMIDQKNYWWLLDNATGVYTVCDPGYAPEKMFKRNEWMVENSSLLIAVYNGSNKGGTAQCVRYARRLGRDVWTIPVKTQAN